MESAPRYLLAGVMGDPVAHSRSPILHTHWMQEHGIAGSYALLHVAPARLEQALRALPALGFAGCNLTIPHKIAALRCMDRLDAVAQRIGAVNTVAVQADGSLLGRNTDAWGYVQSVRDTRPGWRASDSPVVVVGAGGAARAILAGLLGDGASEIRLVNRSAGTAQALAQELGTAVRAFAWEARHECLEDAGLLVNTTSLGMHGQPALDLSLAMLPASAIVSDIVYVPQETPLLRDAHARGNPTVAGLGMLINQARLAFEAWSGVLPQNSPGLQAKLLASF